ncbi:uncharacterized protein PHALS_08667 [Plasmopara halstedii]|uniref:Uncharacterized protein n=1 Tax=Plasmopara halstedii TaxID=4781 RepID=A0A0P1ADD7_PLAHL|nr:uncharacterized protein PHALS_08667 [Plasmopara halstedii]CEG38604.1 hypothetical protein PHALS_08667 [Plasmopara halstedii]|eukprot:XP_024574973.1 hypothetical protein PHALS_08667 [Plasmopara halstedii]
MNVLDLGLFRSIQSLQHQIPIYTIDGLVSATKQAFWSIDPDILNNIFLTWQDCIIEVMKGNGDNNYKIPLMGKASMQKKVQLPVTLICPHEVIEQAKAFISTQ